ncbi:DUF3325 domain-containing protein [Phytopseudomonas punonensis]|uniref:DUF3325 domain-containing protein n=1 Tax=Phytopseudomonas punonensis TaxID=1220495 RepID=A0A1M7AU26_9GAMM|nr:DUF3325 domain-containing protein [Pseudomonas punonensis]SHL46171.1 Protein of unknown function [Pseudomonas punonensis]
MSLNLSILLASLGGFIALALAMEKHCKHLLRHVLSPLWMRVLRTAGWLLLAVALVLSLQHLGWSIGVTAWFGWLSIAGVVLVFYLPKWPWQPAPSKGAPRRKENPASVDSALAQQPAERLHWLRRLATGVLLLVPVAVLGLLLTAAPKPLHSDAAVQGQVGPWTFTLAEAQRKAPRQVLGTPFKAFEVRFCETCDDQIRAAYLKIRKPRSLRAAGLVFSGNRWDRLVEIQIPAKAKLSDGLWLTVEGKDGSVHHAAVDIAEASPALAEFIARQQ